MMIKNMFGNKPCYLDIGSLGYVIIYYLEYAAVESKKLDSSQKSRVSQLHAKRL